jgi:hypothetical protein
MTGDFRPLPCYPRLPFHCRKDALCTRNRTTFCAWRGTPPG